MATIIISIICGFIGGVLGSMVLHEFIDQKLDQKTAEDAQQYAVLSNRIEQAAAEAKLISFALQQLTQKFVRERGALWESLNGLWSDYDRRMEQEKKQAQMPAEPAKTAENGAKPKKGTKASKDAKQAKKGTETNDSNEHESV